MLLNTRQMQKSLVNRYEKGATDIGSTVTVAVCCSVQIIKKENELCFNRHYNAKSIKQNVQ